MTPALTARRVLFAFSGASAPFIDIPEWTVARGSSVSLIGPSGSGKSTLLSLLAGIERPRGSLKWGDVDLVDRSEAELRRWRRRHVGMVFQDFRLVGSLTALENVLLPARFERWSPTPEQRKRAEKLLDFVRIAEVDRITSTLSRGEQQRTALARALLFEPSIVLADEPTASLDEESENLVTQLLLDAVRNSRATLIVATHRERLYDQTDEVVRLDHGKMIVEGEAR